MGWGCSGRGPGSAKGCLAPPLVVCFFQRALGAADQLVARRTDADFTGMATMVLTPAELALHIGFVLPPDAGCSALETESLVERAWLAIPRTRFTHEQLLGTDDVHTYLLSEPMDAEDAYWN